MENQLNSKRNNQNNIEFVITLANFRDAEGIHKVLMQNLVEIDDVSKLTPSQRKSLEEHGFLRKKVDLKFYTRLIKDSTVDVYTAKDNAGEVIGFATIFKHYQNVRNLRDTSIDLHVENNLINELLTANNKQFAYLDQISIMPQYQRKGIGTAILKQAMNEIKEPFVSFIVKAPLANKVSARWHEQNGFKLGATADGTYKGVTFKWAIYIHWNKNNQKLS